MPIDTMGNVDAGCFQRENETRDVDLCGMNDQHPPHTALLYSKHKYCEVCTVNVVCMGHWYGVLLYSTSNPKKNDAKGKITLL